MKKIFLILFLFFDSIIADRCFAQDTIVKQKKESREMVEEEENGHSSPYCDSAFAVESFYDAKKYRIFLNKIYEPAMKDPAVSEGNKAFLKQLKFYLQCFSDSCNRSGSLIYQAYQFNDKTIRFVKDYPDSRFMKKEDTTLTMAEKKINYTLAYINSPKTEICQVKKYKTVNGTPTFILNKTNSTSKLIPAFGTPFSIELEYKTNPKLDRLFAEHRGVISDCIYGDSSGETSFAKLKNVPHLYFMYDSLYNARGIAMIADNKFALRLWWDTCWPGVLQEK